MCGHDALVTYGSDGYGYGFGAGYCFACSYHRTYEAGEHQGWLMEMDRRMRRDD